MKNKVISIAVKTYAILTAMCMLFGVTIFILGMNNILPLSYATYGISLLFGAFIVGAVISLLCAVWSAIDMRM